MPETREIRVFNIARTAVDRDAVRRWLDHIGADEFVIPDEEEVSDPALLVALAGKRCFMSFQTSLNPNLTRIRQNYTEYLDNILASGHGSVLEHSVYTYAIEGITRIGTAELNRHRAGWAISEGSLRFIRFGEKIPYWLPDSLKPSSDDNVDLAGRKATTRGLLHGAFQSQEETYRALEAVWDLDEGNQNFHYKKTYTSLFRRIVGLGVATGGVWTGNLRAMRHVIAMRTTPQAEEEICNCFGQILADIAAREPQLFGDFHRDDKGFWKPKYAKV